MTDTTSTTPKANKLVDDFAFAIREEEADREFSFFGSDENAKSARAALLTYIAQLEQKAAERDEMMTQVYMYAKERDKVLEQLAESVRTYDSVTGKHIEQIQKLEAENAHLMHASEEVMAENVRLQQRVEELEKAARPPLVPKIDPDLGW